MALPDYLILGAQRCGTTSMMNYIADHPGVGRVPRREIKFFYQNWKRGWRWYESLFGDEPGLLHGEKSPSYLIFPSTPVRVMERIPKAKFIALLRNPVHRALSQYGMRKRLIGVNVSFDDFNWRNGYMLERGHYATQLKRWFKHYPRSQFLILKSEDFFEDTRGTMDRVWDFLGLERVHPEQYQVHGSNTEATKVSDESIRKLEEYYAPHRRELKELLGWTV